MGNSSMALRHYVTSVTEHVSGVERGGSGACEI